MLEKYFGAIKTQLKSHSQFGQEFEALYTVERDLEQKMKEIVQLKARTVSSRDKDE